MLRFYLNTDGERSRTIRCGDDIKASCACPVQKSKILYGVFPEDLEEVVEVLTQKKVFSQ